MYNHVGAATMQLQYQYADLFFLVEATEEQLHFIRLIFRLRVWRMGVAQVCITHAHGGTSAWEAALGPWLP